MDKESREMMKEEGDVRDVRRQGERQKKVH